MEGGVLDGYLTIEQLAAQLGKSVRTIARWHAMRTGPPRTKLGQTPIYRVEAVREWIAKQEKAPRPEPRRRR